jgi:hypothetical protein
LVSKSHDPEKDESDPNKRYRFDTHKNSFLLKLKRLQNSTSLNEVEHSHHLNTITLKQSALVLDDLQIIDYLFDAAHLGRKRSTAGLLLGGLHFAGEINNPIVGFDSHTCQTDNLV